jgi:hypothetical protein
VLCYTLTVLFVSYLSNHVKNLFIMYQKITAMAISFNNNICVSVIVIPLVLYMELVLLF